MKEIRGKIGKDIGDQIRVTIEPDEEPRVVEVPKDVGHALRRANIEAAFEKLSYTRRREHIKAIENASQPATRARRIENSSRPCREKAARQFTSPGRF